RCFVLSSLTHTAATTKSDPLSLHDALPILEKGQKNIGLLAGEEHTSDNSQTLIDLRFTIFKDYLSRLNLYNHQNVYVGSFNPESGYKMMKKAIVELGDNLPEAFFAANDAIAIDRKSVV